MIGVFAQLELASSHRLTAASGNVFLQASLRTLFGEVGDKTFWAVLLLAAFCPWWGIRDASHLIAQQVLVFAGALVGLLAHLMMLAFLSAGAWEVHVRRAWIGEVAAGCLMMLLWLRAFMHYAERREQDAAGETAALTTDKEKGEALTYRSDAFSFPQLPSVDHGGLYGAVMGSGEPNPDGLLGSRDNRDQRVSTVLAFVFTAALCFVLEAEDKSWYALLEAGKPGFWGVCGAMLGFAPSVALATLLGQILWFQLEAKTVRFLAICICLALSIVSFSQALLHVPYLEPKPHINVVPVN